MMVNRALLVGTDAPPLQGCSDDVWDMGRFLIARSGFTPNDIRLLTGNRATAEAIRTRLETLITGLQGGDRVLFMFSGHGTQLALRDASGRVDRIHDVICPWDFDGSPERALTDVYFRDLFQRMPDGVEFNWISDSCHSGDLARGAPDGHSRQYPMPVDLSWRTETARALDLQPLGFADAAGHLRGALIAACASNQEAREDAFAGRWNGALTHFLLERLTAALDEPLAVVIQNVTAALESNGYHQTPQLRGNPAAGDRPFFHR